MLKRKLGCNQTKGEELDNILNRIFKEIEDVTDVYEMNNQQFYLFQKNKVFRTDYAVGEKM